MLLYIFLFGLFWIVLSTNDPGVYIFIDLTLTVAMIIEDGGKIEKMSFWTTI